MSEKITIFKQQLFKKNHMIFILIFTIESSHCTLQADKSFEPLPIILSQISHLQYCRVQNSKREITQKASYDFYKKFTKYSTHHSLSANTGFKSLAFILFEILHRALINSKFGVIYSNFLNLTPTF